MRIQDINKLPGFAKKKISKDCGLVIVVDTEKYDDRKLTMVKHIFADPNDYRIPQIKNMIRNNLSKCSLRWMVMADVAFDIKGHIMKNRYGLTDTKW